MTTHSRLDRISALVQQEVGHLLARGLKDPRIGLVTITGAKVAPDLREAWIYYAVHGDEKVRKETQQGLEAASGYLRREMGKNIELRVIPKLNFKVDEAIDRGDRIEQLLLEIKREEH